MIESQLPFGLEEVVINSELLRRPSRTPDYEAENRALLALAQTLADSPEKILQSLAETALQLCRADTAGISLLEKQDGADVFRWEALAGVFSDRRNSTMPRSASPCGTTIDRNTTQLMYMAERVFPALKSAPPVVEALLIPFHVEHKPVGTVWVVAHDDDRKFDREDERLITTLARFASAAWQSWHALSCGKADARGKHQQTLDLATAHDALKAQVEHRTKVEEQLQQLNRELKAQIAEGATNLTRANDDLMRTIEEGKALRQQLRQSEMMASTGALATGLVHDFNNILHVIQSYAAEIIRHPDAPPTVIDDAEVITATVEDGVVMARQLLTVAKNTKMELGLANINDLLRRLTKPLERMLPTTIEIALDLDPRVPCVMIASSHIKQAILNLCINARDAMADGGKIVLQTGIFSGAQLQEHFPEAKEQYVYISVADTGVGMESDVKSRVFESFFTTKEPSQGTGLGLSIVRGIVREHAGFVEAISEPGCGSTFRIYLPVSSGEAAPGALPSRQNNIEDRWPCRETVLYAEDELRLLGLMQNSLEREGFRVLIAQDGAEAVEMHGRHKDEITIAILDSALPTLNGWEALQEMRKINPRLKGILASGYVSAEAQSRVANGELNGVLQKPYRIEEVLVTIKRAIHSQ